MGVPPHQGARLLIGIFLALWAGLSAAQAAIPTYNVTVTTAPNFGNVVSAYTGSTIYTVSPVDGSTTRSGSAVRLSTGDTRAKITVTCVLSVGEDANDCATNRPLIFITAGATVNRVGPLNNFTVSLITDTYDHNPTFGNPINFALQPITEHGGTSAQFYLGFDFTVLGNDSVKNTGVSTAAFSFETCASNGGVCLSGATHKFFSGSAAATVFRPILMSNPQVLNFGRIIRPKTGSTGSVTLDPASGVRTAANGASFVSTPSATAAVFGVTGEGGQVFSINIGALVMTGPGGAVVTPTLTSTDTGASLSSSLGSGGSFSFKVGGTVPLSSTTPDGAYSGSYSVLVQYN